MKGTRKADREVRELRDRYLMVTTVPTAGPGPPSVMSIWS
jgi:hypothetical protein